MGTCYMMQYIDKVALNQATLFGFREDLGLHKAEYSWTASIFFFGYLVWSWPSSYLAVRLPLAKYISACVYVSFIMDTLHSIANSTASSGQAL